MLFSDIGIGFIIVTVVLFFTRFSNKVNMKYYFSDCISWEYRNNAHACSNLFIGCNIVSSILFFLYLFFISVIISQEMIYIHIIAFLFILFIGKVRASDNLECALLDSAIHIDNIFFIKSSEMKDMYIKLRTESHKNGVMYSEKLKVLGVTNSMSGVTKYMPDYICIFEYPDMLKIGKRIFGS